MRLSKAQYVLLLCFCLCVAGLLGAALRQPEAVVSTSLPLTKPQLTQQLAQAEQALQENREELAAMLRAYYMGHAGEGETKRLIDQVEEERLQVEALQKELAALQAK